MRRAVRFPGWRVCGHELGDALHVELGAGWQLERLPAVRSQASLPPLRQAKTLC